MYQYVPQYFIIDKDGEHDLGAEGWVVVFIIFGIEHALLLIGILVSLAIPNVPHDVFQKEQLKEYIFYHTSGVPNEKDAEKNAGRSKSVI